MTEKLKQITKEEIAKLPKEMQEAIKAFDWESVSEEIAKKYLLNESETNDFQVETLLILAGIESGNSYALNIEDNVGTSKEEAEKIAEEVNQKIFTPINDILVENIKKSDKSKNSSPKQTLDFILSGGDYSAFLAPATEDIMTSTLSQDIGSENTADNTETGETVIPVFSIKEENLKRKI